MTSANFKGVAKFRFFFGIWLIWGWKLTIQIWNTAMVQKMASKTKTEKVTPPRVHFIPEKKTPVRGHKFDFLRVGRAGNESLLSLLDRAVNVFG